MKNKKFIIWDWNGTLLNDANYCVDCMNDVLRSYNINPIDLSIYKDKFTFPVKDYYSEIGFDFTKIDFEKPAMEFIEKYYSNIDKAKLHPNATYVLDFFRTLKIKQVVLSAMEHNELIKSLKGKDIFEFFDEVNGINDHYAVSKVDMGISLMNKLNADPKDVLLIGDTIHDFEVATELGVDCILISSGHQSTERLKRVTKNVINDLESLIHLFK